MKPCRHDENWKTYCNDRRLTVSRALHRVSALVTVRSSLQRQQNRTRTTRRRCQGRWQNGASSFLSPLRLHDTPRLSRRLLSQYDTQARLSLSMCSTPAWMAAVDKRLACASPKDIPGMSPATTGQRLRPSTLESIARPRVSRLNSSHETHDNSTVGPDTSRRVLFPHGSARVLES